MATLEKTATTIARTALGQLDQEGRLLNAVLKGPTTKPGRFGFRGDIALKFQTQVADEKRPPETLIEQVLTVAEDGESTIPILAGYLHSFAYLKSAVEVLDGLLRPDGTYFMYCNNIDLLAKYRVSMGDITFFILPCDESTVWKEMLDLMSIDKNDIKKLDTAGKLDYLLDAAIGFDANYETITFDQGLAVMQPGRTATKTGRFECSGADQASSSSGSISSSSTSVTLLTQISLSRSLRATGVRLRPLQGPSTQSPVPSSKTAPCLPHISRMPFGSRNWLRSQSRLTPSWGHLLT